MFDIITIISTFGYAGLTAIVFAESGLFFGFFLPGDSLLFTAGFLASQGVLNIGLLIPLLALAAILGDSVGYAFGRAMGPKLFDKHESRFFKPAYLIRAHEFFVLHGKKAIFLARFAPIIRTFVPIAAGVAAMPYRDFIFFNIAGGLSWICSMTLLGYFLGNLIPNADHYILPISGLIIVFSLIPVYLEYRKNKAEQ